MTASLSSSPAPNAFAITITFVDRIPASGDFLTMENAHLHRNSDRPATQLLDALRPLEHLDVEHQSTAQRSADAYHHRAICLLLRF